LQAANYADQEQLVQTINRLSLLPPLVTPGEVLRLKKEIARAGRGEVFLLQGGDCAESFDGCRSDIISNKLKILLQMSLVLLHGLRKPIIRIGRIAGQYAKPRSSDFETRHGVTLPSYRGDIINSPEFTPQAREPNPQLLLQAYSCSAMTLNFLRALLDSGFADLHYPKRWDLSFIEYAPQKKEYLNLIHSLEEAIQLLETVNGIQQSALNSIDFYTSHEALHLYYEQALTRKIGTQWFNLSTHFPWIGMRTAQKDSAHLEFFRGVENPLGIKIGPEITPDWLVELVQIMNPLKEEGKLVLFTRFGAEHIEGVLPSLIAAVQQTKIPVTWSCDPMHGNTESTIDGIKTRHFDNILNELKSAVTIHRAMKSHLGGVHFELTGENVTECVGGARGLKVTDLNTAYRSLVDPRLNCEQSLEMAFQLSNLFAK